MEESILNRPVFVVGVPRSGTTAFFEHFSRNPRLAWMSNYSRMFPAWQIVNVLRPIFDNKLLEKRGGKDQYRTRGFLNKFLPRPDEAYGFWNRYAHPEFSSNYLLGGCATSRQVQSTRHAVHRLVRYQGKRRFAAKITGPPRIGFLSSIFPDAVFVHVIRDGLAVTHSLLNVAFWQKEGGLDRPWWNGGFSEAYVRQWQDSKRDSGILAALQWKQIIEHARDEASRHLGERYIEIRYEDYIDDREETVNALFNRLDLPVVVSSRPATRVENYNAKYLDAWQDSYVDCLVQAMQPLYSSLGYTGPIR